MNEHDGCIILNLLNGIGNSRVNAMLEACGSISAIFESDVSTLSRIRGIGDKLAEHVLGWESHVDYRREVEIAKNGGVTILCRTDDEYPESLRSLHDAPLCLYLRGTIPDSQEKRSIAMVGTRNATTYGTRMARHLAESAVFGGWITVSGLAIGIDTIVHQATVDAGGATIAVLGGGLARLHPAENLSLARSIIQNGGAILSEFPMTMVPTRHSFPMRNRIIAGLSRGTIVIEAGVNSGSLITAARALEQGSQVFAVPGEADNPSAAGCNTLIKQGAKLVMNFGDILEEFDFLPGLGSSTTCEMALNDMKKRGIEADSTFMLSCEEQKVLDSLGKGPCSIDTISRETGIEPSSVISTLIGLEILHRVQKNVDGSFSKKR